MRKLVPIFSSILLTAVGFIGPAFPQPVRPLNPPIARTETGPAAVSPAPEAALPAESAPSAPAPAATSAAPPNAAAAAAAPMASGPPSPIQPSDTGPGPGPVRSGGRRYGEGTALSLSLAGTLGSWVVLGAGWAAENGPVALVGLTGTLLGPNLGHWYQGKLVTRGTALRLLGGFIATLGGAAVSACIEDEGCSGTEPDVLAAIFLGGVLLYVGGTVDDIIAAPRRARKHNQRLEVLSLTPTATDHSAGLAVGGRF